MYMRVHMMVIMSASVCTQIQKSSLMKVQTGLIGSIVVFVHFQIRYHSITLFLIMMLAHTTKYCLLLFF